MPSLISEIEKGWDEPDNWLLQNYSKIMTFLIERNLLLEKHTEILHKFFDVKPSKYKFQK